MATCIMNQGVLHYVFGSNCDSSVVLVVLLCCICLTQLAAL
jgi:hypothetical protein